jgi:hypothetical protein
VKWAGAAFGLDGPDELGDGGRVVGEVADDDGEGAPEPDGDVAACEDVGAWLLWTLTAGVPEHAASAMPRAASAAAERERLIVRP